MHRMEARHLWEHGTDEKPLNFRFDAIARRNAPRISIAVRPKGIQTLEGDAILHLH